MPKLAKFATYNTHIMDKVREYIEQNKSRFLEELFELLRIPSISAVTEYAPARQRCAEHLAAALVKAGADSAEVIATDGAPIVYGEKIVSPKAKTVLVYGHYDVMPPEPLEEWTTEPFEPVIKEGRIYGRGADDDKGQSFMHIKAFEAMCATDTLPCNVKFLLEGEEESGSTEISKFCKTHKKMLKADVILVSDTSMLSLDTPSITCGLRGIAGVEVSVANGAADLHSGIYGGAVHNPAMVLSKMLSEVVDSKGHITIPGFYADVRELSTSERKALNSVPFCTRKYKAGIGVSAVAGEEGYTTLERTGIRPTFEINGMWSGYTGEGSKTIIPAVASAKITMRLVPYQTPDKITKLFAAYFKSLAPKGMKVTVSPTHGGTPYVSPTDLEAYKAADKAIAQVFGKRPVPVYSGGSIGVISCFEQVLGIKSILLGFGLSKDAIHSPNESYGLDQFELGLKTIPLFYKYFA